MNIFVKTKNVPNVLKCKINHNFFSQTWGSQTGGRGGGAPDLGKIPTFSRFFFGNVPKSYLRLSLQQISITLFLGKFSGGPPEEELTLCEEFLCKVHACRPAIQFVSAKKIPVKVTLSSSSSCILSNQKISESLPS